MTIPKSDNSDIVESYLRDASEELEKLEDRVNRCDNTDIISLSSDFRQSMVGANKVLEKPLSVVSDTNKIKLSEKIKYLEYRFSDLTHDLETNCICNKRAR